MRSNQHEWESGSEAHSNCILTTTALQLTLEKRLQHNVSSIANYTHAKTTDNQSTDQQLTLTNPDPFDPHFNDGLANEDVPDAFFFGSVGELPKLHAAPGIVKAITNGWSLSGIVSWANGQPFTIVAGQDNSRSGVGLDPADVVPGAALTLSTDRPVSQLYFNTAAFTVNALGTFGNSLRNLNYFNVDAGLQRSFPIGPSIQFKFRAEAFDATNHVHFSQPGTNVSAPTAFGKITTAGDPRILATCSPTGVLDRAPG
jgi:hypothetical protein